ncbi:hypothetical protein I6A60_36790 [Frankia sp. AgB1.9]|uniref:hypothetical protein n=1 Tax=unclassified Frankia TaxID=2632575 RepID=UPI0019341F69|nr:MULTISPECIES: hypothetical protein [unclassified Frankia]MBL7490582.1 hypothetical protein [Frankia sp. AgW1.1]MBL7553368.1 hypothetical protein [Frankia sp. AgB1.9]MBL7622247.1 hypothetical protein [Frankia sp. AgB1.8]
MSNRVRQQVQRHVSGAGSTSGASGTSRRPGAPAPHCPPRAGWRRDRSTDDGEHPE